MKKNQSISFFQGVKRYINELTFETNRMLGENNMKLVWKGPYERHDSTTSAAPSNPSIDVQSVVNSGCDAVVFLVFNKFSSDCKTQTFGHEFGGNFSLKINTFTGNYDI